MLMRRTLALVLLTVGFVLFAPVGPAAAVPDETGRYYVVGPGVDGQREYLYDIALRTLGNGNRFREITQLNIGRRQPDGGTFTDGVEVQPGWLLVLPRDANGSGVRRGPLPPVGGNSPPPSKSAAAPKPRATVSSPSATAPRPSAAASRAVAQSPTAVPTKAATAAARRPPESGASDNDQIVSILIRGGAGLVAAGFAVVAVLMLGRGRYVLRAVALDDTGPWPPERHHTPTPAEIVADVETEAPATGPPPPPPGPQPRRPPPPPGPSERRRPRSAPPSNPLPPTHSVPNPAPDPVLAPAKDPVPDPAKDPMPEPAADPVKDPVPEPAADPVKDAVPDPAADPVKDPVPEPAKDPAADPVKDPATATGTASGPSSSAPLPSDSTESRPPVPVAGEVPYLRTDLLSAVGPVHVRLVGMAGRRATPAYAWLAETEPTPPATIPLVLGSRGPWQLHVDLGQAPDVLTVVGALDACQRLAAALALRLHADGVGVAVVGDALGAVDLDGYRTLAVLPDPSVAGETLPDPCVIFTAGLPPGAADGIRALAAVTGGCCVPVVVGPVPGSRWSIQVGTGG
ncbi:hypothetical protein ACIA3K_17555 [Micromonospora sp. NPDC051543]|uniref:hypothetical protein n=1 Tax=Micromonospora sp. NPDC051543 TaxID=3364287 RepID=UPI0037AB7E75